MPNIRDYGVTPILGLTVENVPTTLIPAMSTALVRIPGALSITASEVGELRRIDATYNGSLIADEDLQRTVSTLLLQLRLNCRIDISSSWSLSILLDATVLNVDLRIQLIDRFYEIAPHLIANVAWLAPYDKLLFELRHQPRQDFVFRLAEVLAD